MLIGTLITHHTDAANGAQQDDTSLPDLVVKGNGGMAKFEWNSTEFVLTEKQGIKANDFRKIKTIIDENADIIIKRWNEHFNK